MWSFGVVIYELATGGLQPFAGKTCKEVVEGVGTTKLQVSQAVPLYVSLSKVCFKLKPEMRRDFDFFCRLLSKARQHVKSGKQLNSPVETLTT